VAKAVVSHSKAKSIGFKIVLILLTSAVLAGIAFCGLRVHEYSNRQESIKKDYMVVNSVSFGLLSVDEWRDNIIAAAKDRIQKFKLSPEQNKDLKKEIEQILHALINKFTDSIRKPQKNIGKKIEKMAFNSLVSVKKIHDQVPGYAQKIMDEINKPSSYKRLKNIAST